MKKNSLPFILFVLFLGVLNLPCINVFAATSGMNNNMPPGSLVITSDPQYPWTDKTDKNESESESEKEKRSEQFITEQYNSINAYMNTIPNQGDARGNNKGVIINGDITAFGHGSQWDKMTSLFKILNTPYYFGLGNHDIENNLNDCADNGCIHNSLTAYIDHVKSLYATSTSPTRFDLKTSSPTGSTHYFGSFAYSMEFGRIHVVELNNYPTMSFSKVSTKLGTSTFTLEDSLDWLEQDLKAAALYQQAIVINLHEPSGWKTGPSQRFIDLLKKYNVKAVFAGHYHTDNGLYNNYQNYFGDVPVFISGSAAQKSYLIMEYAQNDFKVYAVQNNDWKSKTLLKTIDISDITNNGISAKLNAVQFFEHSNGLGKLLNDLPHEEWNDTLSSVEVPPYFKVELFENSTFSGATKTLINKSIVPKLYNLYDFNDITSAYKITDILPFPYKR